MGSPQVQAVMDFMSCWVRLDLADALSRTAPDIAFRPDPAAETLHGQAAVGDLWGKYMKMFRSYEFEVVCTATSGGVVFLERIERLTMTDGRTMALPIVAVFELDASNRLTAWRDYWDTAMSVPAPATQGGA